jgi:hypothetical protein
VSFPALAIPRIISGENSNHSLIRDKLTEQALLVVAKLEVLIGELVAIDGLSTSACQ